MTLNAFVAANCIVSTKATQSRSSAQNQQGFHEECLGSNYWKTFHCPFSRSTKCCAKLPEV